MLFLLSATAIAQIQSKPPQCITPTPVSQSESYISSVRLGYINKTTTGTPGAHNNYTNLSTDVAIGSTYTITVKSSLLHNFTANWNIFIDYNHNGVFGDAGELISLPGSAPSGNSVSYTFTIPVTAFNGPATMQVRMKQNWIDQTSCRAYTDAGEIEDYTVNITGGFCYSHGINSTSDYISNVTVSNLSKTSGNNSGYANYTSLVANLTSGFTYPISLSRLPSSGRLEYWTVFIDYNGNKSFADAGDLVAMKSGTNVSVTNINTPFFPLPSERGTRRMRIIMSYDGYKSDPCATITNGEVEDYTVNLLPPVLGTGKTAQTVPSIVGEEAVVSVQPNPAKSSNAVVRYTVATAGNITIRITDLSGRSVLIYNAGNKLAGIYTYALSAKHNLTSGTYILTVAQNGQEMAHNKFIIIP